MSLKSNVSILLVSFTQKYANPGLVREFENLGPHEKNSKRNRELENSASLEVLLYEAFEEF